MTTSSKAAMNESIDLHNYVHCCLPRVALRIEGRPLAVYHFVLTPIFMIDMATTWSEEKQINIVSKVIIVRNVFYCH